MDPVPLSVLRRRSQEPAADVAGGLERRALVSGWPGLRYVARWDPEMIEDVQMRESRLPQHVPPPRNVWLL